jgi:hypothetical protein
MANSPTCLTSEQVKVRRPNSKNSRPVAELLEKIDRVEAAIRLVGWLVG